MKKQYLKLIILISILFFNGCNRNKNEETYVKKLELKQETIAVGIYKATGINYTDIYDIAEAIKIDGGIVYVILNDADVLKTHLDNIDVVIFPEMSNREDFKTLDDEIIEIFKNFIVKKGKGAIGISNGIDLLGSSEKCQSLELAPVQLTDSIKSCSSGLIEFKLTSDGENIFPELKGRKHLFVNCNQSSALNTEDESNENCKLIGVKSENEINIPLFIAAKNGNGKIFLSLAHPETTPGMRWMIPRMVRYVYGKELIQYNQNVFRPGLYQSEIMFNDDFNKSVESLIVQLESGSKQEMIMAMDELQKTYPWFAAKEVQKLLNEKDDDVKLMAAQYLVNIEYTKAIEDIKNAIKKERSRKVREKLYDFQVQLEKMLEQN